MLEVRNLDARYSFLQVLWGVSISLGQGEFVGLLGPNGAGKSTTLRVISGLLEPWRGQVEFEGRSIGGLPANKVTRLGIGLVSETLDLFTGMTVRDNLVLGAFHVRDAKVQEERLERVNDLFPRLAERRSQLAGTLSGGERKMLAIGRALMADPPLLLVDEPSLGLAPKLTELVFEALQKLHDDGHTILLVEQNVHMTLEVVDRAYVLENGRVALQGSKEQLLADDHVNHVYLGV